MTTICKNCSLEFSGNYCPDCGQPANTHKINVHFLWHDIQHTFFHLDKGIFFSIKELFTRPGDSIREFIEGKRAKHFKPVSLIFVLATIYGLLYHYFDINVLVNDITINGATKQANDLRSVLEKTNLWIGQHYALVSLLQLPVYALGTFVAFRKKGYNYVEHLVLNAFLTGQKLIVHIILFPLFALYNETPSLKTVDRSIGFIGLLLTIWTLIRFFDKNKRMNTFLRILLSYLIILLVFIGIGLIGFGIALNSVSPLFKTT